MSHIVKYGEIVQLGLHYHCCACILHRSDGIVVTEEVTNTCVIILEKM